LSFRIARTLAVPTSSKLPFSEIVPPYISRRQVKVFEAKKFFFRRVWHVTHFAIRDKKNFAKADFVFVQRT
jgi:hypothetical protein